MERQLPKNVRQIGNVSDSSKIYVEDYVDTFFNQLCDKAEQEIRGAFLVGEIVQDEEQDYIYVYGAIRMKELELKGKDLVVGEQVWKHACETCKQYFGNAELLGWFVTGDELPAEINHNINKIHQKYFTREKSLFITKNIRDREEKFYIYKYRNMMECAGHYVYYEKNVEMQNYMISTRKRIGFTPSEIIEDKVTKNFRSIIREKEEKQEQQSSSRLVYVASTFLVLVMVIIGVTMMNNYEKIKKVPGSVQEEEEYSPNEEDDVVEAVGDKVTADIPEEDDKEPLEDGDEDAPEAPEEPQGDEPTTGETDTDQPTDSPDTPIQNEPESYVVEKGDTLESISRKKYGDTFHVEKICELNNLEDGNLIFIGQKLLLP